MPCSLYYDPRILSCPYGDNCRDAHIMQSARERAGISRSSSRESNGSNKKQDTRFTPAFNPNHPEMLKRNAGNSDGQRSEAASARSGQPQRPTQAVTLDERPAQDEEQDAAARALSSEMQGRQRIHEILTQRSSSQAQLTAMEDPAWKQQMEAAEAALRSAFITRQSGPPPDKKKQA